MRPERLISQRASATGPVFITGLAHTGKTELRRVLELHPSMHMVRKSPVWESAVRRKDFGSAVAAAEAAAELAGRPRWGVQRKLLERTAGRMLDSVTDAVVIHLVRSPQATIRDVGRFPGAAGLALARWVASTKAALDLSAQMPDRYRVVRTEDLAADPIRALEDLARHVGLTLTPDMRELSSSILWGELTRTGESARSPLLRLGRHWGDRAGYRSAWSGVTVAWTAAGLLDVVVYSLARTVGWTTEWRRRRR